ncbi:lachrymatory-factor synthase [Eucalyptus grandis]|uniref:lachrymatory-factor synthase n=1 Tax=Eucalyptus grandis TaxID=71139 RepID=UPI00192F0020|nr:lachrymatory-factor synthase [Eucalyptus grandis]
MESANIDHVTSEMNQTQPKWQGQACADLAGPKADQIWPFVEDFFGLKRWFPTLTACTGVEGVLGQPGCIRYCAGFNNAPFDRAIGQAKTSTLYWAKEKLLSIDPVAKTLSYTIIDSNIRFNSYVATGRVVPKEEGCCIMWRYEVEPVNGWKHEDLDQWFESALQVMARSMEKALLGQAH